MKQLVLIMLLALMMSSCATVSSRTLTKEDKERLLKERAVECWEALKEGDRGKVYDMYDPFFRARATKEWFVGSAAPIYYNHFEVKALDIRGNVAYVLMEVAYKIEHIGLGKPYTHEDTQLFSEKWLFIDGNWYRQHIDKRTDGTFAHY